MSSEQQEQKSRLGTVALRIFNVVASLGLMIMMLHILANVFTRYLFNSPLPNTLEWVSFWYLPIVATLGYVLAKHANEFIDAPLIFDKLTWGNRRILVMVFSAIGFVVCGAFAYFTFVNEALHGLRVQTTGGVSTLPIWPVFFVGPAIFAILAIMYLVDGVKAFRGELGVHDISASEELDEFAAVMDEELEAELTTELKDEFDKKETLR